MKDANDLQAQTPYRWDYIVVSCLMAAMAVIAFANVLGRYVFSYSIACTEELTIHLFVLLVLVGSGIAFERGGHLGMVTLYNIFPVKFKKFIIIFSALLSSLLFLVVAGVLVKVIYLEITQLHAKTSLGVPVWVYYTAVVLFSPTVFLGIYRGMKKSLLNVKQERS